MEEFTPPPIGAIVSADITSAHADELRDFYADVMGWTVTPLSMGDYDDYVMMGQDGGWGGGVCHLRGANIDQPSDKWVVCFRVENVKDSVERTIANGGKLVTKIRDAGPDSHYAVLEDPQGGHVAIIDFAQDPLQE